MPDKIVGWREWLAFPGFGLDFVKAKVDTGARSSALHAFKIERFERDGQRRVRFKVPPVQRNTKNTVICEAPVHDERTVADFWSLRAVRSSPAAHHRRGIAGGPRRGTTFPGEALVMGMNG